MKRKRHNLEQIIRKLHTAEQLPNPCQAVAAGSSYKAECNETKRQKGLELENTRLKRLIADAELDKAMFEDLAVRRETSEPVATLQGRGCSPWPITGISKWYLPVDK